MNSRHTIAILGFALAAAVISNRAVGQTTQPVNDAAAATSGGGGNQELAKQLTNPVANLIVVPFRFDYNAGFDGPDGEDDGDRLTLEVQPVIPFSLNDDWLLVTRTIVPLAYQADIVDDGGSSQFGLGDVKQFFFLAPKEFGPSGWMWGAGPVFLWPTATNDSLGGEQWGVGPSGVVLYQDGPWTFRTLVGHISSYAGDDDRADVNSTFLDPYLAYTTKDAWTVSVGTEMTRDWGAEQWTIPIDLEVNKLVTINNQPIQFGVGARYFAEAPDGGPEWGLRFNMVFLFPRG